MHRPPPAGGSPVPAPAGSAPRRRLRLGAGAAERIRDELVDEAVVERLVEDEETVVAGTPELINQDVRREVGAQLAAFARAAEGADEASQPLRSEA